MALAPDAQVAAAGRKLALARSWGLLAKSARAVWGECQGSGAKPYQVRADLGDYAAKCSCPSHKFPCKHTIGMLVLLAQQPALVKDDVEPEWVSAWLDKRADSAQRKQARVDEAPAEVDAEAQRKRQEKRGARMEDGLAALELWLGDLARRGLAQIAGEGPDFWDKQAARLVDAQLPGLAARLRALAEDVGSDEHWPARVLAGLGQLALLLQAAKNRATLPAGLVTELDLQLGVALREDEVLAHGDRVQDCWQVLGQQIDEVDHLRVRRSWLAGRSSGQLALLLHVAVNQQAFALPLLPGMAFNATLAFWPGTLRQRALIEGEIQSVALPEVFWHGCSIDDHLQQQAAALAVQPWLRRLPLVLAAVIPLFDGRSWWLAEADGSALPVHPRPAAALWNWLALAGGRPHAVAGEWEAGAFRPLALYVDGRYQLLGEGA